MIRNIISMARANPRWAVTALSLDAAIGTIIAVVVFGLLNLTPESHIGVPVALVASGLLAITGLVALGYALLIKRTAEDEDWG